MKTGDKLIHIWSGWSIPILFIENTMGLNGLMIVILYVAGLIILKKVVINQWELWYTGIGFIIGTMTWALLQHI